MENHPLFEALSFERVQLADFDRKILTSDNDLKCVFFWGHSCPNCDTAKRTLMSHLEEVQARAVRWFEVNVYEDFDLGTRFGLHGIPVFIFFRRGKNLGRVTSFPGMEPFLAAVDKLLTSPSPG